MQAENCVANPHNEMLVRLVDNYMELIRLHADAHIKEWEV